MDGARRILFLSAACPFIEKSVKVLPATAHALAELQAPDQQLDGPLQDLLRHDWTVGSVAAGGLQVHLEEGSTPLAGLRMGSPLVFFAGEAPRDTRLYLPCHCLETVQHMEAALRSQEFAAGDASIRMRLLGTNEDDGSPEAVCAFHVGSQDTLQALRTQCEAVGLLGPDSPVGDTLRSQLAFVDAGLNRVFEAAMAERLYQRLASAGAASLTDDTKAGSIWHHTHEVFDITGEAGASRDRQVMEILLFFLKRAWALGLRQKAGVVYERVKTWVDVWVPAPDNEVCTVCGTAPAAFAHPATPGHRERCIAHRHAQDVDARLERQLAMGSSGRLTLRIKPGERREELVRASAWRPMMSGSEPMSLETWLNRQISASSQAGLFQSFIGNHGRVIATCTKYITCANNPLFAEWKPDRNWVSFRNARLNVAHHVAVEYGQAGRVHRRQAPWVELAGPSPGDATDVCCVNHVDEWLDVSKLYVPLREAEGPLRTAILQYQLPGWDTIVASQALDPHTQWQVLSLVGRLSFKLNLLEMWQKILVVTGPGGCGKSTLVDTITYITGRHNVGLLDAHCERVFALSTVADKLLWIITELSQHWNLPVETFKSITVGEMTTVKTKHVKAQDVEWTVPGICVGNDIPKDWVGDAANAITRRVVHLQLEHQPQTQDPDVASRLRMHAGDLLIASTGAYLETVYGLRGASLDTILSPKLAAGQEGFLRRTQPLVDFVLDCDDYDLAPEAQRAAMWQAHADMHVTPGGAGVRDERTDAAMCAVLDDYATAYSVSMKDFTCRFDAWYSATYKDNRPPDIRDPVRISTALKYLKLFVVQQGRQKSAGSRQLVGLKLKDGAADAPVVGRVPAMFGPRPGGGGHPSSPPPRVAALPAQRAQVDVADGFCPVSAPLHQPMHQPMHAPPVPLHVSAYEFPSDDEG